jgi:hypothetical protein
LLLIYLISNPLPLDKYVDFMVPYFRATHATDVTVVSDKPSRLRDGTPARELEFKMVINAVRRNILLVATHMGGILISANVWDKVTIGEDLKAIPYSFQYETGKDEPVKVPPDIQEFLDRWCSAIVSHDVAKVMTHYSDRFLDSGWRKGELERFWRQMIGPVTSVEVGITEIVTAGDRAYLAGFFSGYWGKTPLRETSIIKESGEWKWYGNQRDVSP